MNIFKLPVRVKPTGSLTEYKGDVIVDKADPSGCEVLKFWNHEKYMSMSEMLDEAIALKEASQSTSSVPSVSFDSLAPASLAPSGSTFGCSTSGLPRPSVVVKS